MVNIPNTTLYSDDSTHIKQHCSKGVQPNGSPCMNNHCGTRYEQSFQHNKHTHNNQKAESLSLSQTALRDAKPTQHTEITHPQNVN